MTAPTLAAPPLRERRVVLAAFVVLAALFIFVPEADLWTSGRFYHDGQWLSADTLPWIGLPYVYVPKLGRALLAVLGGLILLSFMPLFAGERGPRLRRQAAFLLVAAALGQGLFIDNLLKGHWGRARPVQVEALGGDRSFTPAFVPSTQCERNCSFVSGHVAATAFIMGFGWLAGGRRRQAWLAASIAAAGYMTVCRVAQGGHFLSDGVFAWFFTYFSLWLTEWLFRRRGWLP